MNMHGNLSHQATSATRVMPKVTSVRSEALAHCRAFARRVGLWSAERGRTVNRARRATRAVLGSLLEDGVD